MTYDTVATITQVASLLLFIALFIGVLAYAFWPGSKRRFDEAQRKTLRSGDCTPTNAFDRIMS